MNRGHPRPGAERHLRRRPPLPPGHLVRVSRPDRLHSGRRELRPGDTYWAPSAASAALGPRATSPSCSPPCRELVHM